MTEAPDISAAAEVLRTRAGFRRDPALNGRLARCLCDGATAMGLSVADYVAALRTDDGALQDLVDRVTIQESRFFRDEAQFVAFSRHLLPRLETSTIWSAACANGQEPWSLAMLLDEWGRLDCSILATDISTTALARAQRGWYAERELSGVSDERRDRYFVPSDGGYEISPSLRRLVHFAHHNLATAGVPFVRGACRVAFCRNVLIYLTDDEISAVLDRLAHGLGPGGHLFLGYSESLWRLQSRFALRRIGDTFVYEVGSQDTSAAALPAPAPRPIPKRDPKPRLARKRDERAPRTQPTGSSPPLSAADYLAQGKQAAANRDLDAAVVAFRKAAYLEPDDAGTALHLAFALEAMDDIDGARPWFRRALQSMGTADPSTPVLDGWSAPELSRVLARKLDAQVGGR